MKVIFLVLSIFSLVSLKSQDLIQVRQIDQVVSAINALKLPEKCDTLIQDRPEFGLKMTTYLIRVINDGKLIKYVNYVKSSAKENKITREMVSSNTFYFNDNRLIKVDEYLIEGDNKKTAAWYYGNDKCLYHTLQSEQADERANMLLEMGKMMLK